MAAPVSTSSMIINLAIQIGQIAIFFAIFIKVFGSKISKSVQARQEMEAKLKMAEAEYELFITRGKSEYNALISQGTQMKQQILQEAEQLAKKQSQVLLDGAQRQSDDIVTRAKQHANQMEQELKTGYETMVKQTTTTVVNKLINEKYDMYKKYIDVLVQEATKK